eukprot:4591079-Amphidinium_carterae.1
MTSANWDSSSYLFGFANLGGSCSSDAAVKHLQACIVFVLSSQLMSKVIDIYPYQGVIKAHDTKRVLSTFQLKTEVAPCSKLPTLP